MLFESERKACVSLNLLRIYSNKVVNLSIWKNEYLQYHMITLNLHESTEISLKFRNEGKHKDLHICKQILRDF